MKFNVLCGEFDVLFNCLPNCVRVALKAVDDGTDFPKNISIDGIFYTFWTVRYPVRVSISSFQFEDYQNELY